MRDTETDRLLRRCHDNLKVSTRKETSKCVVFDAELKRRREWFRIRPCCFAKFYRVSSTSTNLEIAPFLKGVWGFCSHTSAASISRSKKPKCRLSRRSFSVALDMMTSLVPLHWFWQCSSCRGKCVFKGSNQFTDKSKQSTTKRWSENTPTKFSGTSLCWHVFKC